MEFARDVALEHADDLAWSGRGGGKTSRSPVVLVEKPAEHLPSSDLRRLAGPRPRLPTVRRIKAQCPAWSHPVVVRHVLAKHAARVTLVHDDELEVRRNS